MERIDEHEDRGGEVFATNVNGCLPACLSACAGKRARGEEEQGREGNRRSAEEIICHAQMRDFSSSRARNATAPSS